MTRCAHRYEVVRRTQIALFKQSGVASDDFDGLVELFGPERLAEYLELTYWEVEEIQGGDSNFEVAGLLDRTHRTIYVSRRFPPEQRRLTGMHELVHWMLHEHVGRDFLHRDRPISHLPRQDTVDWYEWEATNVACQYLMTEKMVKDSFAQIFFLVPGEPIEFNENVAFFLGKELDDIRKMDLRQRALLLATADSYGRPIVPLFKQFKVSSTALAIRLQELDLLARDRWRGKPDLRLV